MGWADSYKVPTCIKAIVRVVDQVHDAALVGAVRVRFPKIHFRTFDGVAMAIGNQSNPRPFRGLPVLAWPHNDRKFMAV